MVFCVIHRDSRRATHEDEEVYVVVPGAAKTAIAVALDALPQFLPLLEQAVRELPVSHCAACNATLPSFAVCSSPHNDHGQSG